MENRKSTAFKFHCLKAFEPISSNLVKTFKIDRGKEFADYDVYFSDLYSSWQRCTNENTNGLLIEFYPKKFNFSMITQDELDILVKIINNIPSKYLGYRTPAEIFAAT